MRILLLGANGQLGTDIAKALSGWSEASLVPLKREMLDVADYRSIGSALAGRPFDVLINCTGYHKTDEVETNAQRAADVNAFAVYEMAAACARVGARFVHFSTDYVFDGRSDRPYLETDLMGPLNVYGATKAMGESLARRAHDNVLIFRVASLFGIAGSSGKGGNFVETMIRVGRERGYLRVIRDQVMSPTSTADVASCVVRALRRQIPEGVYHAVNSGRASWFEFAVRIIERSGVPATVEPILASEYPLPARRPAFSVLDNTKVSEAVAVMSPWEDALDRYLDEKNNIPR